MVDGRVAPHQHGAPQDLFQLFQITILIGFQGSRHLGVDAEHNLLALHGGGHLVGLLQDVADNGLHALHVARAFAVRARRAQRALRLCFTRLRVIATRPKSLNCRIL